jgi:hypothetical protein
MDANRVENAIRPFWQEKLHGWRHGCGREKQREPVLADPDSKGEWART